MATINQILSQKNTTNSRNLKKKKKKDRTLLLEKCPQKKAICLKNVTMTPRKPNSARRNVQAVKIFSTQRYTFCGIPGPFKRDKALQKFAQILVQGGNVKDLRGVKYKAIRGVKDLKADNNRRRGPSKYGVKTKVFIMRRWRDNRKIDLSNIFEF